MSIFLLINYQQDALPKRIYNDRLAGQNIGAQDISDSIGITERKEYQYGP